MKNEGHSGAAKRIARVIRDYDSTCPDPLILKAGQQVIVGRRDDHWRQWIWCRTADGQGGWVPESYIGQQDDGWVARRDYESTELTVKAGQTLVVVEEESDWYWCTKETGEGGWVPAENVEILSAQGQSGAESECAFCHLPWGRVIAQNELAIAIRDDFPVTPLHTLVIPRRHVQSIFDLQPSEVQACHRLLLQVKNEILSQDDAIRGFNVGVNQGRAAGQTVFHCHVHLIPRREGDVEEPRGGVRHVIPGKGCYPADEFEDMAR